MAAASAAADSDPDGFDHQPGLVSVIAGTGNGKGAFEQIGLNARKRTDSHGNGRDASSAVLNGAGADLCQQFVANRHFMHFGHPGLIGDESVSAGIEAKHDSNQSSPQDGPASQSLRF